MSESVESFPYDTFAYARSLAYLGSPAQVPGLPWPVIMRPIPGSERFDALGPWPYGSPVCAAGAIEAMAALRASGAVTFVAFLRPDHLPDTAALRAAGMDCAILKAHFVCDCGEPMPAQSRKTRYNLAAARRRWTVETLDVAAHWPALADMHAALAQRRVLSRIAQVDAHHFERLSEAPGVTGLGVFEHGDLVAALVVVRDADSIHFHALLGREQAYRERAFYALFDEAVRRWGPRCRLYMGGVPSGADAAGVGKFKQRFATSTRPLVMVKAVLDAPACAALAARRGAAGFFPPYRTPAD